MSREGQRSWRRVWSTHQQLSELELFSLEKARLSNNLTSLYNFLKGVCSRVGLHCLAMPSHWSTSIPKSFSQGCSQFVHPQTAVASTKVQLALSLVKPHIFPWTHFLYSPRLFWITLNSSSVTMTPLSLMLDNLSVIVQSTFLWCFSLSISD